MNSVRIVADAGCDLSPTLVARYDITLVPVFVSFGQEMVSSDNLTLAEFWARAEDSGLLPGTAAPSPDAFHCVFQRQVSAGHDVICFTLPGSYSGTFNSAWVAAQSFGDHVRVVDSGSISLGMGLQVLNAARLALAGQGADFIQRMAETLRERTSVVFVLDTLEWARRGGRLARIMPLLERVTRSLNVKPVIELCNGEFRLLGVTRSGRGAVQRLHDEVRSRLPVEAVATAYTRSRETASDLVGRLSNLMEPTMGEFLMTEAGPVFAAHAGPGALGVVVIRP